MPGLLQLLAKHSERVRAVKIVRIDHCERLVDYWLSHQSCVAGAPWFGAVGRDLKAGGDLVQFLERVLDRQPFFELTADDFAKRRLDVAANHEHSFTETGPQRIV